MSWASPGEGPNQGPTVAGATLGDRYQLIAPIAAGGMARVWSARDTELSRDVAIKILHPHLVTDEGFVARFRREAVASARLQHRSIVSVFDTISTTGIEAIVMELIDGQTLRALLDAEGALSAQQVVEIGHQIADALAVAHATGLVHRDIKPANIMVRDDGRVLVTDFGIAKAADDADLTSTGTLLGTAKYLSPEQVTGAPIDPRSDLYSLGVVLFESLAGTVPFKANTDAATALARIREEPPPVGRLRPNVPGDLERVINRLMARDLRDRFAAAGEVAQALSAVDIHSVPLAQQLDGRDPSGQVAAGLRPPDPPGGAVPYDGLRPPDPPRTPVTFDGSGNGAALAAGGSGYEQHRPATAEGPSAGLGGPAVTGTTPGPGLGGPRVTGSVPGAGLGGPAVTGTTPGSGLGGPAVTGTTPGSGLDGPPVTRTMPGRGLGGPASWPAPSVGDPAGTGRHGGGAPPRFGGRDPSIELLGTDGFGGPSRGGVGPIGSQGDAPVAVSNERVRGSRWLPVLVLVLVAIAVAVAAIYITGLGPDADEGAVNPLIEGGPGLPIVSATSFDPLSADEVKLEREELVPFAFDGDPETAWTSEPYRRRALGGLKQGVGLLLTLEESLPLNQIELETRSEDWQLDIFIGEEFGPDPSQWGAPAATIEAGSNRQIRDLARAEGSVVLLWIRDTGQSASGRFQFVLGEITIR